MIKMSMLSPLPSSHHDDNDKDTSIFKEIAKHKAKQKLKKRAKIAAAKMSKMAAKAIKAAAASIAKVLGALASTIGVPVLFVVIGIILLVIIINLVSSFVFGTGEGLEGDDAEIHEYIVASSNSTVDMNSDWERPYRVPVELIAATVQLDYFKSKSMDEIKDAIDKMSTELAPEFTYGDYNEWTEKQVLVYEDGKLVKEGKLKERTTGLRIGQGNLLERIHRLHAYTSCNSWQSKEEISYRTETYYEEVEVTYIDYVYENIL